MGATKKNPFVGNADYWWYKAKARLLDTYFGSRVHRDSHVLDIGSADGPSVNLLTRRIGFSGSKIALDIDATGLGPDDIHGSVEDIPVKDESYDLVFAFDVIEHVQNEAQGLREIFRVLKPGGEVFISVPAYQWAWSRHDENLHHFRRYTRGRLQSAVREAGFHSDKSSYALFGTFPIFALQRLFSKLTAIDFGETPKVSRAQEAVLLALVSIDSFLLRLGFTLPWGSSVLLRARKPELRQ